MLLCRYTSPANPVDLKADIIIINKMVDVDDISACLMSRITRDAAFSSTVIAARFKLS